MGRIELCTTQKSVLKRPKLLDVSIFGLPEYEEKIMRGIDASFFLIDETDTEESLIAKRSKGSLLIPDYDSKYLVYKSVEPCYIERSEFVAFGICTMNPLDPFFKFFVFAELLKEEDYIVYVAEFDPDEFQEEDFFSRRLIN